MLPRALTAAAAALPRTMRRSLPDDGARQFVNRPGPAPTFGGRTSGLAERAAAIVSARSPLIAVSGVRLATCEALAISSRYGPMR